MCHYSRFFDWKPTMVTWIKICWSPLFVSIEDAVNSGWFQPVTSQIAMTIGSTSIRHRSDTFASDRYLFDGDSRVFLILHVDVNKHKTLPHLSLGQGCGVQHTVNPRAFTWRKTAPLKQLHFGSIAVFRTYRQATNMRPVGAAPTTSSSSFVTSSVWAKTTARLDEIRLGFGIWCVLY